MNEELLKICDLKEFKKGDVVLRNHDKSDGMYIIKSGTVDIEREGKLLATMKDGDFFGAMSLMLHEKRSADVIVTSDVLLAYFLSEDVYEEVKDELDEEMEKALHRYADTYYSTLK